MPAPLSASSKALPCLRIWQEFVRGSSMPAMALLDTDGVYGAPRFHMAAKKLKIKAHIGAEVTCDLDLSF